MDYAALDFSRRCSGYIELPNPPIMQRRKRIFHFPNDVNTSQSTVWAAFRADAFIKNVKGMVRPLPLPLTNQRNV